jgi:hypothetical protein
MGQNSTNGEGNARVVLRCLSVALPGSDFDRPDNAVPVEGLSGKILDREGTRLVIELDPLIAASVVAPGNLVEIQTERFIYLGQIRARRGAALTISIEHSLDAASLTAIQRVWNRSAGPPVNDTTELPDSLTSILAIRTIEQS